MNIEYIEAVKQLEAQHTADAATIARLTGPVTDEEELDRDNYSVSLWERHEVDALLNTRAEKEAVNG